MASDAPFTLSISNILKGPSSYISPGRTKVFG